MSEERIQRAKRWSKRVVFGSVVLLVLLLFLLVFSRFFRFARLPKDIQTLDQMELLEARKARRLLKELVAHYGGVKKWSQIHKGLQTKERSPKASSKPSKRNRDVLRSLFWPGLPFEALSADRMAYFGEFSLRGRRYQRISLEWKLKKAEEGIESCLLLIAAKKKELSFVQCISRQKQKQVRWSVRLEELSRVKGVLLPASWSLLKDLETGAVLRTVYRRKK